MRALLSVSALALAVTGCTVERSYAPGDRADVRQDFSDGIQDDWQADPNEDVWQEEPSYGGSLPITAGRVRGDIGAVTNFDATTDYVDSWGDEYYTSITLNATDTQGRVGMLILDVTNMDLQNVAEGSYSFSAQNIDGSEIYVTGCSSSSDSYYDAPAEEGSVVVQDNPDGTRDVDVEVTLPGDNGSSQAQASFTLE